MKIAFVCFYEAYPPVSGAASVSYNVAKYSQGERILIQFGKEDRRETTRDGVTLITLGGASDNRFQKIKGLYGRIKRIVAMIRNVAPDVIVLEGASWVVYHWLLLRQVRHKLSSAKVIYHSHNVEYYLRKEKHGRIVTWLSRWAEGNILRSVDLSFAVSEVDGRQFEELYGVRPDILPNGVDLEKFDQVSEAEIRSVQSQYGFNGNTILFMGSYFYKPNREAIDFLIKSVMPKIIQACPNAQMVVIGGEVPYKEEWLINPGCISYDRLPAFVKACEIGVAPIFSGSGTRLKILEYMAAEKPVVATSKGAEGLEVTSGRDILVAEDSTHFASEICRLLSNDQLAASLGGRGREVVTANYSWDAIRKNLNAILGDCYGLSQHIVAGSAGDVRKMSNAGN